MEMAFRQQEWLAARQSTIAANIANANTPGYHTMDVEPFRAVMDSTATLAATNAAHFGALETASIRPAMVDGQGSDRQLSKNDVEIEKEFLKSGEVMRGYSLNSQVIKSFHQMIMTVTKV
ncbi:MAG: flagellar basal body protein [Hyphomicrobium sp.]